MYEDKTLVCKECGNEFVFTAGEQEFYAEKGFETSRSAAKPAVRLAKKLLNQAVNITIQFVPNAAVLQEYRLNRLRAKNIIAVNALRNCKRLIL